MTFVPAEWARHRTLWVGWPSHPDLWQGDLSQARAEVSALVKTLANPGGEQVHLLCSGTEAAAAAQVAMIGVNNVTVDEGLFGDIWLRDTGPIFTTPHVAHGFVFNGWGGKYQLPGDEAVSRQIAQRSGASLARHAFVLEGGALDHDGEGTVLTTRQCLLNHNRNPGWSEADAEAALKEALGVRKVLWLGEGLANDHTDGHVDNLARFIAPGEVVCPMAWGRDDQNADVYDAAAKDLAAMTDAAGRKLTVHRIPSPGRVVDADGYAVPASHMNFVIANEVVIVPVYAERPGLLAVEAMGVFMPDKRVIGLRSHALLTGGGSFHCITQQQPD